MSKSRNKNYVKFTPDGKIWARPRDPMGRFTRWTRVSLQADPVLNNVGRMCDAFGSSGRPFLVVAEYRLGPIYGNREYMMVLLDVRDGREKHARLFQVGNLY